VRIGMEATGYSRWFERLLAELGFELWIGDPAEIKAKRIKKQKTDRNDARLLLRLMREDNFPRVWVPSPENRDLRQLLWHRHRLVWESSTSATWSMRRPRLYMMLRMANALTSVLLSVAWEFPLLLVVHRGAADLFALRVGSARGDRTGLAVS
jgi:hypothetical protein